MFPGAIPLPSTSAHTSTSEQDGTGGNAIQGPTVAAAANGQLLAAQAAAYASSQMSYSIPQSSNATAYNAQSVAYYQAYYNQTYGSTAQQTNQALPQPQLLANQQYDAAPSYDQNGDDESDDDPTIDKSYQRNNNVLPVWGNEKTMNLNTLLLTNIQQSPYFKVNLFGLKAYHEVVDEIWYSVKHLEPWERGSRKVSHLAVTICLT